ncbi:MULTISPECIES: hypothetical protein [Furfurilactobacillus]|uniref:Uncharacterized protein n=2 Tax=Furfurilactobacillus TaxID=2767882 RepID=A0A0R1RDI0_9LACO|nr:MULTISPECIES: hypothetical protein [Furfurilactobacillus]KRL55039.1 hypothetical protein FD35_GL002493 [Furfurilactobacillus rossiae DSM 15814]MCF6160181.1 hypothetical protein [Furfurilactobacillus milii]MCF6162124.1 hypothetical protein [Furfurilactobacillus milii]MCF6165663.1 hypothetical protein [Furfurilactobacillus rossiae]MCF6420355.1 hypothetical protein [Furfurilactobacillus milii]
MITNVEDFLPVLKGVLRGSFSDDRELVGGVVSRLQDSDTVHYGVTRWRAKDTQDHEFTFKKNEDGTFTYLYKH